MTCSLYLYKTRTEVDNMPFYVNKRFVECLQTSEPALPMEVWIRIYLYAYPYRRQKETYYAGDPRVKCYTFWDDRTREKCLTEYMFNISGDVIYRCDYSMGRKDGQEWGNTPFLAFEASNNLGTRYGPYIIYHYVESEPPTRVKSVYWYDNGKQTGREFNWFKRGTLESELSYIGGKQQGEQTYYYECGPVYRTVTFSSGIEFCDGSFSPHEDGVEYLYWENGMVREVINHALSSKLKAENSSGHKISIFVDPKGRVLRHFYITHSKRVYMREVYICDRSAGLMQHLVNTIKREGTGEFYLDLVEEGKQRGSRSREIKWKITGTPVESTYSRLQPYSRHLYFEENRDHLLSYVYVF